MGQDILDIQSFYELLFMCVVVYHVSIVAMGVDI